MSPKYLIAAGTALCVLAGPAFAQGTVANPPAPGAPPVLEGTSNAVDEGLLAMSLDDLEGRDVYGVDGNDIGEIERLVRSGNDVYAVLDIDQWFDLEDEDYLVPLAEFRLQDDRLTLPITEEQADALQQYREDGGFAELDGNTTLGEAYQTR